MKRLLTIIFAIIIITINSNNVLALTVNEENISMNISQEKRVELYANVEENITAVEFDLYFTTYDIPANFKSNSGITDTNPNGPHHKLTLSTSAKGQVLLGQVVISTRSNPKDKSGTINLQNATAITESGKTIRLNSKNIEISIVTKQETKKDTKDDNKDKSYNLLKSIDSKIVKINLENNVYEYKVVIKNDIQELDLKPIAIKDNYKIEVSNQKISELTDNKITIKVTDDEKHTQEYTIKVEVLKEVEHVKIDDDVFKEKNNYQGTWLILIIILTFFLVLGLLLLKKGK